MSWWQNFKYKAGEKYRNFMVGRYGVDELYQFSTYFLLALILINLFVGNQIISIIELVLLILTMFRPFSRNYQARYKENARFLKIKNGIKGWFKRLKMRITDKDHAYRKCPNCKKTLRLPKQKGKHHVNCPNCHHEFEVKI